MTASTTTASSFWTSPSGFLCLREARRGLRLGVEDRAKGLSVRGPVRLAPVRVPGTMPRTYLGAGRPPRLNPGGKCGMETGTDLVAPGRVVVVTGAASGIGFGLAERFAAEGMRVVMADVEEPALVEAAQVLRADGAEVLRVPTDVSRADHVEALRDRTLSTFGAVHVVCNNAGVGGAPNPVSGTGLVTRSRCGRPAAGTGESPMRPRSPDGTSHPGGPGEETGSSAAWFRQPRGRAGSCAQCDRARDSASGPVALTPSSPDDALLWSRPLTWPRTWSDSR